MRAARRTTIALLLGLLAGACRESNALGAGTGDGGGRPPRALGQAGWEEIHTGGEPGQDAPGAGEDCALAYDPTRHELFLYGGKGDDDVNRNELWSFDVRTRRWRQIVPEGVRPHPREDHSLVLDTANDALVLFGGEDGPTSNETWIFDLQRRRWKNVTDGDAPPLESHVAIYDPRGRRMIVFGGMEERLSSKGDKEKEILNDTWAMGLDPDSGYGRWTKVETHGTKPSPRREHRGQYDPVRHRMILFGGRQRSRGSFLNDAWILDLESLTWHEIEGTGERPDPIRQMAIGFDPGANTLTVFGGEVHLELGSSEEEERTVNQVWVLDVALGSWSDRTPYPRPMYDHSGVFVPELGGTLIYGGSSHKIGKEHSTWLLRMHR